MFSKSVTKYTTQLGCRV